jgi:hypothetical protein
MDTITTTKIYKKDTEIIQYLKKEIYKKYNIRMSSQDILHLLFNRNKKELKNLILTELQNKIK